MTIRKNSGMTTAEAFRTAVPPAKAPSESVARAVWKLVELRLMEIQSKRFS